MATIASIYGGYSDEELTKAKFFYGLYQLNAQDVLYQFPLDCYAPVMA